MTSVRPVAVVTGAGAGIGEATARLLIEQGHEVVAVDRDESALEWARADAHAVPVVADVSLDYAPVVAAVQGLSAPLVAVVLNAGIAQRSIWEADDAVEVYDRTMAVNARGVMLGIRTLAPLVEAAGGGGIVIVASTSGVGGDPMRFAYNASKAAAINLARAAALDWAVRGVRVNVVAPGPTRTGIFQGGRVTPEHIAELTRNIPLQRLGTPAEQAQAICFLASPAASFITGAVLMVDGGITANAGVFPPPLASGGDSHA